MITGVILAGGRATRMGGHDKGLIALNGEPLYLHVLSRLKAQVNEVMISANRNQAVYAQSGCRIISDFDTSFPGPLAGILSGLHASRSEWVAFVPCDVPALPCDLVNRLWQARGEANAAYATDGERPHPTLLLINKNLIESLETYLHLGNRKLMLFMEQVGANAVSFSDQPEAFRNMNSPEDLSNWEKQHRES
ncbi:molybdenum cofactor guanylyltransferase MobA [Pectobacterium brasiliense]|uniref:molybdenum cofactor guanylyltransferase MobA n=1 Tax=Pectobacterium brasiliense TaxID=180957 RepID=UPI0006518557|nr:MULTISPECIES: molybdenum cofactor guanylyltransferase MobA [Pectobacterium]KMK85194.1 molybdopterin-guanine dinucleotide biosynthesis protein MobA [Pectobacterium brasiliense ICMP 19477]MBN3191332.1 molybdenum cofactor guanylyltransferase MobA [Pectobacterium brasiliense]MCA5921138.1 molybdenum cofactor guanylyltransferase MobA [Pectobacterium brasiliense]MCA5928804.1 molybdenum cofactor guanylyltransferase MobA [Pectobacterium brasiliense]MCA5937160.1 molybdenum cofactor guanylyltransferas